MNTKARFIKHYKEGYMPWAHSNPDFNLIETIQKWKIEPCKTLEIGCGTGTDAIWLAEENFEVTAIDVSPIAIDMAMANANKVGADCHFRVKDFLSESLDIGPFDFVFDRGYFHSFESEKKRRKIAKKIARNLAEGGLWLSLIGSCDNPPRETGPPMRSAKNIIDAVETYFEILFLKASVFGSEQENPAKNWVCLMKKRK
jgi:SAM-dependent methyltransferase